MNSVWPEAHTLRVGDGDVGVVVCHGFTGSVMSVAPWAHAIADGCCASVIAPRLSGHGTTWQDLDTRRWQDWYADVETAHLELASRCRKVFVAGLSMGGALALRLAECHDVAGVLLVNPAVTGRNPLLRVTGVLRHVVRSQAGIASDIVRPGVTELGYDRFGVTSVWQMTQLWRAVRGDLSRVTAPVLLFRSVVDHVVDDSSHELLLRRLQSVSMRLLPNSYHVATLDNDAPAIFAESVRFINDRS